MKKTELMKVVQCSFELQNALLEWVDKEIESHFEGDKLDRARAIFEANFEGYDENMWLPSLAHIDNEISEQDKRSAKYREEHLTQKKADNEKIKADIELKKAIYSIPDCQHGDG